VNQQGIVLRVSIGVLDHHVEHQCLQEGDAGRGRLLTICPISRKQSTADRPGKPAWLRSCLRDGGIPSAWQKHPVVARDEQRSVFAEVAYLDLAGVDLRRPCQGQAERLIVRRTPAPGLHFRFQDEGAGSIADRQLQRV
jgi:hypothetical protein